jgi:Flp pilus assembly protein TadG
MKGTAAPRDRGALLLSYVIIVPVFLAALMVIAQAAMWYLARSAALAAARQGVDAARVMDSSASAGVAAAERFAQNTGSGYLLSPRAYSWGSSPDTIEITVQGNVPSLVPGVPIHVSQVVEAPVERFTEP